MTVPGWVYVADLADLTAHKKLLVTIGTQHIALFLNDGHVYALQNTCIHKGRPLSRGVVLGGRVVCPGHQWAFDLRTGQAEGQAQCQPTYPARVEAGRVFVIPVHRERVVAPSTAAAPLVEE